MDLFAINEVLGLEPEQVLVADHGEICRVEILRSDAADVQEVTIRRTRLGAVVPMERLLAPPLVGVVQMRDLSPREMERLLGEIEQVFPGAA